MARKKVNVNPVVGQRIKHLRVTNKKSQIELAKELGYDSGNTILYWENGRSSVPADVLARLAKIFDVSLYYLIGESDSRIDWSQPRGENAGETLQNIKRLKFPSLQTLLRCLGYNLDINQLGEYEMTYYNREIEHEGGYYYRKIALEEIELHTFINSIDDYIKYQADKLLDKSKDISIPK